MTTADLDLLTTCVMQEAGNQVPDGKAGVARVVLNRTRLHYASDGTVMGTILRHAQFSWTEYAWVGGHYSYVAKDAAQEAARVERIMEQCKAEHGTWLSCQLVAGLVEQGRYHGTLYDRLTDDTVLYYAPSAVSRPAWAVDDKFVAQVGGQRFYRA